MNNDAYREPTTAQLASETARIAKNLTEAQIALSMSMRGWGEQFVLTTEEKAEIWKALETTSHILERLDHYRQTL